MNKKQELKINVGGSSIILIIVVFALSIFAILSIKASNSDLVLAKKTKTAINEYYQADSKAEQYLADIDQLLQKKDHTILQTELAALDVETTLKEESASEGTISYAVKVNDYATLQVELAYNLGEIKDSLYDIRAWKVKQETVGEYDFTNFQFWDGTIEEE